MSVRSSDFDVISRGDLSSEIITLGDISDASTITSTPASADTKSKQKQKQQHDLEEEKYAVPLASSSTSQDVPASMIDADHLPEQMTVLHGLDELTLLDKRITKKISQLQPIRVLARRLKTTINPEQFAQQCTREWQSLHDLITRRDSIKSAILRSNIRVQATVVGQVMTVAELVERRKNIAIHRTLLNHMRSVRDAVIHETDKANQVVRVDALKVDLEAPKSYSWSFVPQFLSGWFTSTKQSLVGRYSLDPLILDERITALQMYVDSIEKEARFILADLNARTIITITAPDYVPGASKPKGKRTKTNSGTAKYDKPDPVSPAAAGVVAPTSSVTDDAHSIDPLNMSILRALSELPLVDQRIAAKTEHLVPMRSASVNALRTNIDQFTAKCMSDWSTLSELLARRQAIKSALIQSNAAVMVVINGERLSVAEAVERKKTIKTITAIRNQLQNELAAFQRESTRLNTAVEAELAKFTEIHLNGKSATPGGGSSGKNAGADLEAIASSFHENNAPRILDPLGVESRIKELDERIEQIEREAKFALSEANARTKIDITEAIRLHREVQPL